MKKGFLKTKFKSLEIPTARLIAGVVIGLLFSFVFYSFLYVVREVFRTLSQPFYASWFMSDREVNFYNLFFAFISVIFGQSICFNYWINRPKKVFKRERFRRGSIVNDQRFLMWFFLSWFAKLGVVFGMLSGITLSSGFYVFNLYPDYNYVFILIIAVLFLQSWNTISVSFKGKSLKWMMISAIAVSLISYGFSKIDVVDYKSLNSIILQKNIQYQYNLTVPESDTDQKYYREEVIQNIYMVKPKNQNSSEEAILIVDNKVISLDSVSIKLHNLRLERDSAEWRFLIYRLNIDKGIKTGIVNDLKFEISKLGTTRVAYAVVPSNPEFDQRYYRSYSIFAKLPGIDSSRFNIHEAISYFNQFEHAIEIVQLDNGACLIGNKMVELDSLYAIIQNITINGNNHYFKLFPNDKVEFSKYISLISQLKQAVNDTRDSYSVSSFSTKFNALNIGEQRDEVIKKYPFRLIEFSDDLITYLTVD